ncbi:hypothetical protein JIG36_24945 [Actinoplanes sp. LDG1-06]|uniref:FtsX extracellular domain-containing protein n=1 Tax=Paractinoplanes ovalisporus TaxID=2810368 RepID=A0ABS2AG66_9ACTN|nr:permease-like cell division protein FtsX [Actinoplanes ovalisporus]MBM2618811.1 hypothetical protein [Actinoplanes ovalisporus]
MRRLVPALVALSLVTGLTGCGLFGESDQERLDALINKEPRFIVILKVDATEQQKAAAEVYIKRVPHVVNVKFQTREEFYAEAEKAIGQKPSVGPESMPQLFKAYVPDADFLRAARDSKEAFQLKVQSGVSEVVWGCLEIDECPEVLDKQEK